MTIYDYSLLTDQEFDDILDEIVEEEGVHGLMSLGDVNTIVREHFNEAVLDAWAEKTQTQPGHFLSSVR